MAKHPQKPSSSLHLNFNPKNRRYRNANSMIDTVKQRYKTAFLTACVELYQQAHPYGIDYRELEEIQKETWTGFLPKVPIWENLHNREASAPPPADTSCVDKPQGYRPAVPASPPVERPGGDAIGSAMDQLLDFYNDDPDEDD